MNRIENTNIQLSLDFEINRTAASEYLLRRNTFSLLKIKPKDLPWIV